MNLKSKGFTLTELLMVVVILGILGGIAIPRYFPQAEKARVAEAVSMLSAIRQAEEGYRLENGTYLALATAADGNNWLAVGIEDPNLSSTDWGYSVTAGTGNISTTFSAIATRTAAHGAGNNAATTVTLSETGTYGGSHPNRPT